MPTFNPSAMLMSIGQQMIGSFLGSVLMGVFTSNGGDSDKSLDMLHELHLCMAAIAHAIGVIREEMHRRFDDVDRKLRRLHEDIAYFAAETQRRLLRALDTSVSVDLRRICLRVDAVLAPVMSLQRLCGDALCELQWDAVKRSLTQFEWWVARYGDRPVPDTTLWRWALPASPDNTRDQRALDKR
jgi:hypothetical protein